MKVGILTYHRVVNLGSVVQAWCVVELAKQLFPDATVEVIDYRPTRMELREKRKLLRKRYPFWNRQHAQKTASIRRFVDEFLPLTGESLTTNDAITACEWIDAQGYDVILVGSDTIWELRKSAYSPEGTNAFFLPFETSAYKVALAASMDPIPEFDESVPGEIRKAPGEGLEPDMKPFLGDSAPGFSVSTPAASDPKRGIHPDSANSGFAGSCRPAPEPSPPKAASTKPHRRRNPPPMRPARPL